MAHVLLVKKDPCPFCDRAVNFLNARGIQFETLDLTNKPDEIQKWKDQTGWKTVPIILINDQLVGGYTDLKALDEEGRLEELLQNPSNK